MKQYLSPEQTAKLIELGLPRPRCLHNGVLAYNIGELIEMLPPIIVWKRKNLASTIARTTFNSFVSYAELDGTPHIVEKSPELIDALYAMILQLKEEEVI
jgi:hypothetical protein